MLHLSAGAIAQLSTVVPLLCIALWSFLAGSYGEDGPSSVPESEISSTRQRRRKISIWKDRTLWWLQDEVIDGWGTRLEWLFGVVWTLWLSALAWHSAGYGMFTALLALFCISRVFPSDLEALVGFMRLT